MQKQYWLLYSYNCIGGGVILKDILIMDGFLKAIFSMGGLLNVITIIEDN